MDDLLISRAAAIIVVLRSDYNLKYVDQRNGLSKQLEQLPAVDAIPVEWLKQQFYDNPKSQWAEKCRDVYTKWQKWQRWQKEQEAR